MSKKLIKFKKYVVWSSPNADVYYGIQALDELSDFIKYAHPRMKDHQKLLRNLMILEMVMRVLEKFDPKSQYARYSHVPIVHF